MSKRVQRDALKIQRFYEDSWRAGVSLEIVVDDSESFLPVSFPCEVKGCTAKSPEQPGHADVLFELPDGWVFVQCEDGGCKAIYCPDHADTEVPCRCW